MKIAACYIARNEANTLRRSFRGLTGQVDGIFLADTGSTDDTVKVAEAAGARVFSYLWQDDFAAARNFVLKQVPKEYDWILFLDADEYLLHPEELRPYLLQVDKEHPEKDGIMVNIVNIDADDGDREFHRFLNIRLFRHKEDIHYAGRVHEMICYKDGRGLDLLVERRRLLIYHTGYSHGIVRKKIMRNLALLQADIREHGEGAQHYRYLSDCYFGLRDYAKALVYAEKAIASSATAIGSDSDMYRHILESMRQLGHSDQAMLTMAEKAIAAFPDLPDFYAEQGMILCGLQQPEAAEQSFEYALRLYEEHKGESGEASYFAGVIDIVWRRLGQLYQLAGNRDKAELYIHKALMHNRYMLEAFEDYYQFHEKESVDQIADSLSQFFEDTEQDNHYLLGAAGKVGDWGLMQHYAGRIHELTLQERHILMLYQQLAVTDMDLGRNLSAQAARAVHDLFLNLLHIDGESAASRAAAELLPRPLQQCLLGYWGGDMPLTESQVSDYLSVLPAIIQAGNRDMLQRYIRLAADFSCIGRLAVGRCLYQHEAWEAAAEVYEGLSGGSGLETAFWQEKGIIAMHRGERATALEAFQQAQSLGDVSGETVACLYWLGKEAQDG